jgi:hypothetical protein
MEPGAARIWLNGRSLAFSHVLRPNAWDESYGDLAMLELDISKLDVKDREELRPIVLDAQLNCGENSRKGNLRTLDTACPS